MKLLGISRLKWGPAEGCASLPARHLWEFVLPIDDQGPLDTPESDDHNRALILRSPMITI